MPGMTGTTDRPQANGLSFSDTEVHIELNEAYSARRADSR
jgi:hypothetical protein